jgi:endonuclease/exonuclease/phosphatase family metal-dependent hydrolase
LLAVAALAAYCEPRTLRIATYNVENFFDRYNDPYTRDSSAEYGTSPKSARELWSLAKVIKAVNADVLALQEVENRNFLEEFNRAYLNGLHYRYVVLIEGNNSHEGGRGIDVALLSRVPVAAATTYQYRDFDVNGKRGQFSRDLLHVKLAPPDSPVIHCFVLHAPSKLGGAWAETKRQAEAREAMTILAEECGADSTQWVVVTGDFNDEPDSASLGVYTAPDAALPLHWLPAADKDGAKFTWYGKGEPFPPARFDHILASRPVITHMPAQRAMIWNDAAAAVASDHRPVYIDIALPTVPGETRN